MDSERETKFSESSQPQALRESVASPPAREGSQGIVIPGYQPVEKLGSAPSFGIWLRALQTRMDRRVLLKLLPPGLPATHEYFAREITTLVRLDGAGVLRVIDEGSAEGVRYLVSDEAASRVLEPGALDEATWLELARMFEGLYRQLGEWNLVLLPVAPSAIRRLPSGDFTLADLGYLLPFGAALPDHPSVPEPLRGTPAQAWVNARFLGLTLKSLEAPRAWRKWVADLAAFELNPDKPNPLADSLFSTRPPVEGSKQKLAALAAVLFVLCGLATFGAFKLLSHPDPASNVTVTPSQTDIDPEGKTTPSVDVGYVPPPETNLEREARESLANILGDVDPDKDDPFALATPALRAQLSEWLKKNPAFVDTLAEKRARRVIQYADVSEAARLWGQFESVLARVLALLEENKIAAAEAEIEALEKSAAPLLRDEIHSLRLLFEDLTERRMAKMKEDAAACCGARAYDQAIKIYLEGHASLSRRGVDWAERERTRVEAEGRRYGEARTAQRASIDAILEQTGRGEWSAARTRVRENLAPEEFPELRAQGEAWIARLDVAEGAVNALCQALAASRGRTLGFRLFKSEGEVTVRGTVVDEKRAPILPRSCTVKKEGVLDCVELAFREFHLGTLSELVPNGITTTNWALMLFFLGDTSRALKIAEQASPQPEWFEDARALVDRLSKKEFDALLQRARASAQKSSWDETRELVIEIYQRFPREWLEASHEECLEWLRAYWRRDPLRFFPSVTLGSKKEARSTYDEKTGVIHLVYDFSDSPRDRSLPDTDWERVPGANNIKIKQPKTDYLSVHGLVYFQPGKTTDLEIFEQDLEVVSRIRPVPPDRARDFSPNMNFLLWSKTLEGTNGLLFGIGWRHANVPSVTFGPDTYLMPAHVIGELPGVEQALPDAFHARPVLQPKLEARLSGFYSLKITSRAAGSTLELSAGSTKKLPPINSEAGRAPPDAQRRGTVAIQTYDSLVHIEVIEITGKLRPKWLEAKVEANAREDLGE